MKRKMILIFIMIALVFSLPVIVWAEAEATANKFQIPPQVLASILGALGVLFGAAITYFRKKYKNSDNALIQVVLGILEQVYQEKVKHTENNERKTIDGNLSAQDQEKLRELTHKKVMEDPRGKNAINSVGEVLGHTALNVLKNTLLEKAHKEINKL